MPTHQPTGRYSSSRPEPDRLPTSCRCCPTQTDLPCRIDPLPADEPTHLSPPQADYPSRLRPCLTTRYIAGQPNADPTTLVFATQHSPTSPHISSHAVPTDPFTSPAAHRNSTTPYPALLRSPRRPTRPIRSVPHRLPDPSPFNSMPTRLANSTSQINTTRLASTHRIATDLIVPYRPRLHPTSPVDSTRLVPDQHTSDYPARHDTFHRTTDRLAGSHQSASTSQPMSAQLEPTSHYKASLPSPTIHNEAHRHMTD